MKKSISIIGGGPAALALASFLDKQKYEVTIYEKKKALGRKFLVAGKGGFNLTHAELIEQLIQRYTPSDFLETALRYFDNNAFRDWLNDIGIPTFVGSSHRVYPVKEIKPIEVLKAIQTQIEQQGVCIQYGFEWTGWDDQHRLVFNADQVVASDYTVFAMGGGSWKITGSDGTWINHFQKAGIQTNPFQSSNCAFQIAWGKDLLSNHEGSPIKNVAITCGDKMQKGEVVCTKFGLEGNAIYALSPAIRTALTQDQIADIFLDLKPTMTSATILSKIEKDSSQKMSAVLKNTLKLSAVQRAILKAYTTKAEFLNPKLLAQRIKKLKLTVTDLSPLDEAISTVGGVDLTAVDEYFQLKKINHQYCIGEMLDWDTPTGGYLIQGCISMGVYLAKHFNDITEG